VRKGKGRRVCAPALRNSEVAEVRTKQSSDEPPKIEMVVPPPAVVLVEIKSLGH